MSTIYMNYRTGGNLKNVEKFEKLLGNNTLGHGNDAYDYSLDITSEVCPLTFVKAILLIERMERGQTAEIYLSAGEAVENVPRAVTEHGHRVLDLQSESPGVFRLRVQKN